MSFCEDIWAETAALRAAIHALPFNRELAAGTLDPDRFRFYVVQDALYLGDYARALALAAARAGEGAAFKTFADGALVLQDASTGDTECLEGVDSLIAPAVGIPNDALVPVLSGNAARPVLPVGDCVAARSALEAIFEGHQAGRTL